MTLLLTLKKYFPQHLDRLLYPQRKYKCYDKILLVSSERK